MNFDIASSLQSQNALPTHILLSILFEDQQFEKRYNRWRRFSSSPHCKTGRVAWQGKMSPWLMQPWGRVPSHWYNSICYLAIGNWTVIQISWHQGRLIFSYCMLVNGENWTISTGGEQLLVAHFYKWAVSQVTATYRTTLEWFLVVKISSHMPLWFLCFTTAASPPSRNQLKTSTDNKKIKENPVTGWNPGPNELTRSKLQNKPSLQLTLQPWLLV